MTSNLKSLLIVDDDAAFLRVLSRAMSKLGYVVWPAETLEDAKRAVEAISPDFAVVDLHLGDENGIDVVDYISESSPKTTTVMLSGYVNETTVVRAIKAGAADCLVKPVDADELDSCLETVRAGKAQLPEQFINPTEARARHILAHWEKNDRNTSKTAEILGMHRRSLQRILIRVGMGRNVKFQDREPSAWIKMRRLYSVWSRPKAASSRLMRE